jgi:hypothetical protein
MLIGRIHCALARSSDAPYLDAQKYVSREWRKGILFGLERISLPLWSQMSWNIYSVFRETTWGESAIQRRINLQFTPSLYSWLSLVSVIWPWARVFFKRGQTPSLCIKMLQITLFIYIIQQSLTNKIMINPKSPQ